MNTTKSQELSCSLVEIAGRNSGNFYKRMVGVFNHILGLNGLPPLERGAVVKLKSGSCVRLNGGSRHDIRSFRVEVDEDFEFVLKVNTKDGEEEVFLGTGYEELRCTTSRVSVNSYYPSHTKSALFVFGAAEEGEIEYLIR